MYDEWFMCKERFFGHKMRWSYLWNGMVSIKLDKSLIRFTYVNTRDFIRIHRLIRGLSHIRVKPPWFYYFITRFCRHFSLCFTTDIRLYQIRFFQVFTNDYSWCKEIRGSTVVLYKLFCCGLYDSISLVLVE